MTTDEVRDLLSVMGMLEHVGLRDAGTDSFPDEGTFSDAGKCGHELHTPDGMPEMMSTDIHVIP